MATTLPTLPPDASDGASRWLDQLLTQCLREQASDLHFEPVAGRLQVRRRIDGLLQATPVPAGINPERMVSRLKLLARMDIGERRRPQDGRWAMDWQGERVHFRVSSMPTVRGEKLVLRVLRLHAELGPLEELGYSPRDLGLLRQALRQPDGLILFTGPTGAGKSLSLYHCLNEINSSEINITTVEDPVEMVLPGIHQVAVHEAIGLDFAQCLRALLRQDPDVLMVGEIRDLATAKVAVQAAQTGHLVLSTLHCNDAAHAMVRLQDLGLPPYHVATCLRLVTAQRLVRRLCPSCRGTDALQGWVARGCPVCRRGYRGRIGLFEVMTLSPTLQHLVLQGADSLQLARQARADGVTSLREDGLAKAQQGLTTRAEVEAVTHD
ncbi:MAG: GspE/PulE family protein [Alphaproteobacteria bacterium]|nr:GspE/PulE family protein [Alphaproteobacteria bacterium]